MTTTPSPGRPTPVTVERLRALATSRGEFVRETEHGVIGQHGGRAYQLVLFGTDLVLRTRWSRLLPHGARRGASQLVNDWNRDRVLPTLHTEETDDGIAVVATHSTNVLPGMTQQQLTAAVELTLAVTANAMSALGSSVPVGDPPTELDDDPSPEP